ncbi:GDSL-type esterase/lipase family protein [Pseudalkalibacillus berkeleyi]|uniref:GDSL-type esterase/lipase family protein n=1 Tax=Pseudalkalibacillus berkeleyi TaxID=1069813 RepID=A0ABS9H0A9_9BACL|nr:GDSL-type esterase/lipase family protein [Pseudalkalibacillus berkeleyi]MCF6137339.1 GDSL-type esterase/lipase family protein [Pseudalkalibacillus berkeleyi]
MEKKKLTYVAIGDSLTIGIGTSRQTNFVSMYTNSLEEDFDCSVNVHVFARNGAKTNRILDYFKKKKVRQAIKDADVISITAGGNDLKKIVKKYMRTKDEGIIREAVLLSMKNISSMINEIHSLKQGESKYLIRVVGLYNPYSHLNFSHKWIRLFNDRLKNFESDQLKVVEIYEGFEKGGRSVLSIDRLHPNKEGYLIITKALLKCGYVPLVRKKALNFTFPYLTVRKS